MHTTFRQAWSSTAVSCLSPCFGCSPFFSLSLKFIPSRPGLSLWQVPPYTSFSPLISPIRLPPTHLPTPYHYGPACHCGRSRCYPSLSLSLWQVPLASLSFLLAFTLTLLPRLSLSPLPLSSPPTYISSCHPARAGRHGRSKVILLTFAKTDPQVIFWPFCTSRSTSCTGLSGCASPSGSMSP